MREERMNRKQTQDTILLDSLKLIDELALESDK